MEYHERKLRLDERRHTQPWQSLQYYGRAKGSVFEKKQHKTLRITRLLNTAVWMWELDVDDGSRRDESTSLKTNSTGGCLAYLADMANWTNMHGKRVIIHVVHGELLLSTVKRCKLSLFGHVIVVVVAYRRRHKSMGDHYRGGVCRITPQRHTGVTGVC